MDEVFIAYKKRMIVTNIVTSIAVIFLAGLLIAVIWAAITFPLLFWYLNRKSKDRSFIDNLKSEAYKQKPKKVFRYVASSTMTVLFGFFVYNSLTKNGWTEIDPFKIVVAILFLVGLVWLIKTILNK